MRLLIATTHRAVVGGVETYLRELLPALAARGHELALLHEHPACEKPAIDAGADGVATWDARGTSREDLLRQLASWRPEAVYVQGLEDVGLEEALVSVAPAALFAHGYHGTCISGSKRHAFPSPQPCTRVAGAACLALYYPRRCGGLHPRTLFRHYRLQRRRRALLPRYRAVLVASRHMRQEFERHGVDSRRLHLAPLFPAGSTPDPQPPSPRPATGRVLLAGRLTDLKGGTYLVRALATASRSLGQRFQLVVAGDGPERTALERLAARLDVPAEFHGWVNASQRTALMRAADVLAIPSVWPEPFGLVGIEAGCVGLPAVGYGVGGILDWLRPGESGELAPGDLPTVGGLADALARALACPTHWLRLRRGAWETAQQFSRPRHVEQLEAILREAAYA